MGLKGYTAPTEAVELPGGGSFTVRGLSLPDVIFLVQNYAAPLEALFNKFSDEDGDVDNVRHVAVELVHETPRLAAAAIALASDEPEEVETILTLPFPVQIDAIEKMGKLTFDTTGGPKKVVETVIRVFRGTSDLMVDLRTSQSGSLASAGK